MTTPNEMLIALWAVEQKLFGSWLSGPAFRVRWTPDPVDFELREHAALAQACRAMALVGAPGGDLEVRLMSELRSLRLLKLWTVDRHPLNGTVSTDPDADLAKWRELRCLIALHRSLQVTLSGIGAGSDLSLVRESILRATSQAYVSGALPTMTMAEWRMAGYQDMCREVSGGSFVGFAHLDELTGGARGGDVWVLGAPTNWGKSSWLIAVADHYSEVHRKNVLLVSCEDNPVMLGNREVCRNAGIRGSNARHARLTPEEHAAAAELLARAVPSSAPVIADGRGRPVEILCEQIRHLHSLHKIDLVLIDYLQCISSQRVIEDRRGQINWIARSLTDTIKGIGAAGILASQLTGEDIRESRDVEHAAEVVIIGRKTEPVMSPEGEEVEPAKRTLLVKKNKSGPNAAVVELQWDNHTGSFVTRKDQFDWDAFSEPAYG